MGLNLNKLNTDGESQKMDPKVEFQNALLKYKSARYLLYSTFPSSKDPRLLMGIIYNISTSLESAINYLEPKNMGLRAKLVLLRKHQKIVQEDIDLITKLKEIIAVHEKSPVEFRRGNKQIICNKDYNLEILSINGIEGFLNKTEAFLKKIDPTLINIK